MENFIVTYGENAYGRYSEATYRDDDGSIRMARVSGFWPVESFVAAIQYNRKIDASHAR